MTSQPPLAPALRAVRYLRISRVPGDQKAKQVKENERVILVQAIRRQDADTAAICEAAGYAEVCEPISDEDETADVEGRETKHLGPRPGYERLLDLIDAGAVDVIVAYNQDRLWRDVGEQAAMLRLARKRDVRLVHLCDRQIDPKNPGDTLVATIMTAIAQHELATIKRRVQRAVDQLVADGRPGGGPTPFGYRREGRNFEIVPDEAAIVRRLFAEFIAGKGTRAMARELAAAGVPTRRGARWSTQAVGGILRNPLYIAKKTHHDIVVGDATWPPIVDELTFRRVAKLMDSPARKRWGGGPHTKRLLTGLLHCGRCGTSMNHGMHTAVGPIYNCRGCYKVTIKAEPLEEALIEKAFETLNSAGFTEAMARDGELGAGELLSSIEVEEAELKHLLELRRRRTIGMNEWLTLRDDSQRRLTELRAELEDLGQVRPALRIAQRRDDLEAAWKELTTIEQRGVLSDLFGILTVLPGIKGSHAHATREGVLGRVQFAPTRS